MPCTYGSRALYSQKNLRAALLNGASVLARERGGSCTVVQLERGS